MAKRDFSKIQHIVFFIEALLVLPLIHIFSFVCPYTKIYEFSKYIGQFLLYLSPNKKGVIRKNLTIIYPNKVFSDNEFNNIARIIAGYEIRIILEMIAFTRMSFQDLISYIRISQPNQISKIYHSQNRSFIGYTLHYGNWELLGCFLNQLDIPLYCLVERQFNPWIDKYLQNLRSKLGLHPTYNEISLMKPILKHMKNGGGVALVADQTYWFDPLFIPFFGQEAAVPQGTAALALKMKSNLFCGYTTYLYDGIYSLDIISNISNIDNPTSSSTEELMKIIYKQYENIIVQNISNWYTLGSDRWGLTHEKLQEWNKNPDSSRF